MVLSAQLGTRMNKMSFQRPLGIIVYAILIVLAQADDTYLYKTKNFTVALDHFAYATNKTFEIR